jgi:hypothetical protein
LLHASQLCYDSLYNTGSIRIVWTDALSMHLHFVPESSVLYLFRYPSFCILNSHPCSRRSFYNW